MHDAKSQPSVDVEKRCRLSGTPLQPSCFSPKAIVVHQQIVKLLRKCVASRAWKYRASGPNATEPAALAALALCAHDLHEEARPIAAWFAQLQTKQGSVGVTAADEKPAWPTSLAVLTWLACDNTTSSDTYNQQRRLALDWIQTTQGKRLPKRRQIGHDTSILGWSWAENTHSWLEPTCFHVLALKASGQSDHARTRDGIAMIVDRLHESGGCNYGNTVVLGQSTLPHIQPTGLAMLAIAGETIDDPRIARSLEYLERSIANDTATASLCFALFGLTAHGRRPQQADTLLKQAFTRDESHGTLSCYKLGLLALAGWKDTTWLPSSDEIVLSRQLSGIQ